MILDDIVAAKRLDLEMEEQAIPLQVLLRDAENGMPVRDFHQALSVPGLSVIAEVKKASPSQGLICADFDPADIARQYEAGGAAAISVLTERHWFLGCNRHLRQVSATVALPVLRKDFIISDRQVIGARAIGADAILLIAAILDDGTLRRLYALAEQYGMHCLFEAHSLTEVKRAADAGAKIIGINNRNLKSMQVDLSTFETLRLAVPSGTLAVAESGIHTPEDAQRMRQAGADAILVGESLMRAQSIADALASLRCV